MNDYIPYLLFGVVDGSLYGLAAMGLVLSYKSSGVLNFGHGAIAAMAAVLFYALHDQGEVPWPLAALITVLGFGFIGGLLMERFAAVVSRVPTQYRIVGTVGIFVALSELPTIIYGTQPRTLKPFLPQGEVFTISGVIVTGQQLITALVGLVAAVALFVLFRVSRLGKAMRAVVDDPALLDMTGFSPARVRRRAWLISCIFTSASGVLLALKLNLDAVLLGLLVIQAFGAATFGAFRSLPLVFAGGLALGLLQDLTQKEIIGHPRLDGLDSNVPFLVLFLGLLVIPPSRLLEIGRFVKTPPAPPRAKEATRRAGALVVVAAALVLPALVGVKLPIWLGGLAQMLLFLSLALLVRTSGQVSLCQVGFAAVGAAAFGHLAADGLPWGAALLVAGLVTMPVGALVAIPAIRLSGLYLALATLGFGVLLFQLCYRQSFFFGQADSIPTPRPAVLGLDSDKGYYYLLLALLILAIMLVSVVENSRLGRLLRAMADSPLALTTLGLSVNAARVIVFALSSFLAGISGALYGGVSGTASGTGFIYLYSLVLLAVLAISGRRTVPAAIVAGLLYVVVPGYVNDATFSSYLQLAFGVAAVAVAVCGPGSPIWPWVSRRADNAAVRLKGPAGARYVRRGRRRPTAGIVA
jgi:ABC-type branched-subunit amino acid transport system permease subunit